MHSAATRDQGGTLFGGTGEQDAAPSFSIDVTCSTACQRLEGADPVTSQPLGVFPRSPIPRQSASREVVR